MQKIALVLIQQYYTQLQDLNNAISLRPESERFPTSKEVDIMRKLLFCIKELRKEMAFMENQEQVIPQLEAPQVTTTNTSFTSATIHNGVSLFAMPTIDRVHKKNSRITKIAQQKSNANKRNTR
ncbi:MAG: hypothetical protein WCG87_01775 [Bacteroidota bacterium]